MTPTTITLKCPSGHAREVDADFAGKQVVCDECGAVLVVPAPEQLALVSATVLPPARRSARPLATRSLERGAPRAPNPQGGHKSIAVAIVAAALILVLGFVAYVEWNKHEARVAVHEVADRIQAAIASAQASARQHEADKKRAIGAVRAATNLDAYVRAVVDYFDVLNGSEQRLLLVEWEDRIVRPAGTDAHGEARLFEMETICRGRVKD